VKEDGSLSFIAYKLFKASYIFIIAIFLLISYLYFSRINEDGRRKKRFRLAKVTRQSSRLKGMLQNESYDKFFRAHGLPNGFTSERYNLVRLSIFIAIFVIIFIGVLLEQPLISTFNLFVFGTIPIAMIPKKPSPVYFLLKGLKRRYLRERNNEVYQLFNDIKAEYKSKGSNVSNTYHLISSLMPYYKTIKPTLERMLPLLEQKKNKDAWEFFENDINTEEASRFSALMQDVEHSDIKQTYDLLDESRKDFANSMYNAYSDFLKRRKTMIFFIVATGAVMVSINEFVAFYLWYKDVMSTVNQVGR